MEVYAPSRLAQVDDEVEAFARQRRARTTASSCRLL
jgi:hypothetical protein